MTITLTYSDNANKTQANVTELRMVGGSICKSESINLFSKYPNLSLVDLDGVSIKRLYLSDNHKLTYVKAHRCPGLEVVSVPKGNRINYFDIRYNKSITSMPVLPVAEIINITFTSIGALDIVSPNVKHIMATKIKNLKRINIEKCPVIESVAYTYFGRYEQPVEIIRGKDTNDNVRIYSSYSD